MTESQLNKWQKELARIQNREYKKVETELQNTYRYSLDSMLYDLKKWSDAYPDMTFSQKREFERQLQITQTLSDIVAGLTSDVNDKVTNYLQGTGERGYQGVMYALEGAENVVLPNTLIDPEYVQTLIDKPVAGKRLSTRLYQNTKKMADRTSQSILDGLWRGDSYERIAGRVRELTGASFNNAIRVVRTEGGRIQSETTNKAYEDAVKQGISLQKRWLATLDGKTRHDHRALDGQTVPVIVTDDTFVEEAEKVSNNKSAGTNGYFNINGYKAVGPRMFGVASEDINCRCTTIPIVDGIEPTVRRNNETGRAIKYRTYDEWKEGKRVKKAVQPGVKTKPKTFVDEDPDYSEYTTRNGWNQEVDSALDYYVTGGAYDINMDLRDGYDNKTADVIADFIDKNRTKKDMTLYRKVKSSGDGVPDYKVGSVYADKAFTSTAKTRKGDRFNEDSDMFEGDVELHIDVPKGSKAFDLEPYANKKLDDGFASEEEVLLQRGTKIVVDKVEYRKTSYPIQVSEGGFDSSGNYIDPKYTDEIKVVHAHVENGDTMPKVAPAVKEKPAAAPLFDASNNDKIDAMTYNEVRKYVADDLGFNLNETSRTKLSETALKETAKIVGQFQTLYEALPMKIPNLTAVTASKAGQAIAWYRRGQYRDKLSSVPQEFGLNVKFFDNLDELRYIVERNVESGFFSQNKNPNHVMIHEFGHHIDYQLTNASEDSGNAVRFANQLFVDILKDHPDFDVTGVSKYAQKSYNEKKEFQEPFAEWFAEAYGKTPRDEAKIFREYFEKKAKEILGL